QVRIVLDASVILAELYWLAGTRNNPVARTALQEAIASGTVLAFAPLRLEREVREHLPRIAEQCHVTPDRLEQLWVEYKAAIRFHEPKEESPSEAASVRDPDDLPYVYLCAQVGAAAVYSKDTDFAAMGAPLVTSDIILSLRDYARAATLEVSIKLGGVAAIAVTLGAL